MAEQKAQHPRKMRRVVPASSSEEGEEETGGDVGVLARADSSSSTSSSSFGVVLARASSRKERQSMRRVQPLGEDESEEARVRGVPVPAVHLPDESKVRRPESKLFLVVDFFLNRACFHVISCMCACALACVLRA